jgi:hypothetical protein
MYKLRLSVVCPLEQATSYADVIITTNSPPTVKSLKVRTQTFISYVSFYVVYAEDTRSMSFMRYRYILKNNIKVNLKKNLFTRCKICGFILLAKLQHGVSCVDQ